MPETLDTVHTHTHTHTHGNLIKNVMITILKGDLKYNLYENDR